MDTLDLSNQELCDIEIEEVVRFAKTIKKIKGLRLSRNRLTSDGFLRILDHIPAITNLNISFNQLNDDIINHFLNHRKKLPNLRIVNLSNNRIN